MSKRQWSTVFLVVALVIDVTAVVVFVPAAFGPPVSRPSLLTQLMLPLIVFSLSLIALSTTLRRQPKRARGIMAATETPDAIAGPDSGSANRA